MERRLKVVSRCAAVSVKSILIPLRFTAAGTCLETLVDHAPRGSEMVSAGAAKLIFYTTYPYHNDHHTCITHSSSQPLIGDEPTRIYCQIIIKILLNSTYKICHERFSLARSTGGKAIRRMDRPQLPGRRSDLRVACMEIRSLLLAH